HRRARVPRRALAVPVVPDGPVGPAAGARGLGPAGDLQRTALDARPGLAAVMRLVGRRLLMTLPTLFGVLVVAFLLLNVAPGGPAGGSRRPCRDAGVVSWGIVPGLLGGAAPHSPVCGRAPLAPAVGLGRVRVSRAAGAHPRHALDRVPRADDARRHAGRAVQR